MLKSCVLPNSISMKLLVSSAQMTYWGVFSPLSVSENNLFIFNYPHFNQSEMRVNTCQNTV
ncbi:hypothetical protein VIBNISFn118_940003 [Vibrio nigripulchritudo SFn118]|nr:hypothetical protein VIBNISFn118_940003 [Vibrio nigripulchritudo SFn118]